MAQWFSDGEFLVLGVGGQGREAMRAIHKAVHFDSTNRKGRLLQPGDLALTDINGGGMSTVVQIVERDDTRLHGASQSGVQYRVTPCLQNGNKHTWYDADWFDPCPEIGPSEDSAPLPMAD